MKRKHIAKQVAVLLVTAMVALMFSVTAFANSLAVVDDADLLSLGEEEILIERIEEIRAEYNFDITFVTTYGTAGQTTENFARNHSALDQGRDGIVFAIDMDSREYHTVGRGYGQFVVSDEALDRIDEVIVSDLSDGEFYEGFYTYLNLCVDFLDAAATGESYAGEPIDSSTFIAAGGIGVVGGIAVAFLVTAMMISSMNTARKKTEAADYVRQGSFNLARSYDRFLYENTVRTAKPKEKSGGGGGSSRGGSGGGKF